jgi:hypothetical protein
MRTSRSPTEGPTRTTIPVQAKLAALWASLMFLYLYVDLLSLYQPGVIDGILDGRVWELDITQTWAVGALALMAIPIAMVSLSLTLPARANRLTNLIVATLYAVVSIANAVGETTGGPTGKQRPLLRIPLGLSRGPSPAACTAGGPRRGFHRTVR